MKVWFAKYQPLSATPEGLQAANRFKIPPFVDGSCRREPDLEADYPSITALCRCGLFAPKLCQGDWVVYATFKGYYGQQRLHWRITAILEVVERLESHLAAEKWYESRGMPLPSNCMVSRKNRKPIEETLGIEHIPGLCRGDSVEAWDKRYFERAQRWPVFLVCGAAWRDLMKGRRSAHPMLMWCLVQASSAAERPFRSRARRLIGSKAG